MSFLLAFLLPACLSWQQGSMATLRPDKQYLEVGLDQIRYEVQGEGKPVLMIHGFGSSLETWGLVSPLLAQDHKVVGADMKGFGLSSKYQGDYSPSAMADALLGVLDQVGVSRTDVVAHSYGCAVALAMALDHPERVRRLVLTDAFAYADQLPWFFAWARAPLMGEALFSLFYDQNMDYRMDLSFHDPRIVSQDMVERAGAALDLPGTRAAALSVVRGMDMEAAENSYGSLRKPVLVVWGGEDEVTGIRYGERLAQQLPRARMEVFTTSGHFPMVEAPERYAMVVGSFLAGDGQ